MKNSLLLPVLIGAAAARAMAWFLLSEETLESRESLLENLTGSFEAIKEKAIDKMSA